MRHANLCLSCARLEPEYVISLFAAHAASRIARLPRFLSCGVRRTPLTPPLAASVEIGFEQSRALRVSGADLFKQLEELGIPQRRKISVREAALEALALHAAAVMVENHLDGLGADARLLARGLSRSEKPLESRPRRHGQAKPVAI